MRELSPLLGKSGSPLKGEKGKTGFYICEGQVENLPEQSCTVPHTVPIYKVRYLIDSMLSNCDSMNGDAAT